VDFKKVGDTAYSVECTQITEKMQWVERMAPMHHAKLE
jgi:hypothetical protein